MAGAIFILALYHLPSTLFIAIILYLFRRWYLKSHMRLSVPSFAYREALGWSNRIAFFILCNMVISDLAAAYCPGSGYSVPAVLAWWGVWIYKFFTRGWVDPDRIILQLEGWIHDPET